MMDDGVNGGDDDKWSMLWSMSMDDLMGMNGSVMMIMMGAMMMAL